MLVLNRCCKTVEKKNTFASLFFYLFPDPTFGGKGTLLCILSTQKRSENELLGQC